MKLRLTLAIAVSLTLVGAVAALFVSRFDPIEATQAVKEYVRDRYGRELAFEGPLQLTFWPVLAISVPRAQLSETGSDEEAARFSRAEAEIAWLPLLGGSVIVERLRIVGLHMQVRRRADGSHNIDNLFDPSEGWGGLAPGDEPPTRLPRVEIGQVEITEASLEYRDPGSSLAIWFDDIDLKVDELARRMVTPISVRARAVAAEGPSVLLRISGTIDLDPARRTVGLRGAEASARGFLSGRPIDINARARRAQLRMADAGGALRLESFAIGLRASGSDWTAEGAHFKGSLLDIDSAKLSVTAAALEANARGKWGASAFDGSISVPDLVINDQASRGKPVDATLRLRSEHELDIKLSLDGWSGSVRDLNANKVTGLAEATQGALSTNVRMNGALRADLDTASIHVAQIAGMVSAEHSGQRPLLKLPLAGSAHAELAGQIVKADVETRIDNSLVRLRAAWSPQSTDSALTVQAQADQVDGERWLNLLSGLVNAAAAGKSAATVSATDSKSISANADRGPTLPSASMAGLLENLADRDWLAVFEIGRLRVGSLHGAAARGRLRAGDGMLRMRSLAASAHGGQVSGEADILPAAGIFYTSFRARDIDAADWLRTMGQAANIEGRLDLRADLHGRLYAEDWLKSLAGQANLRLDDGRLNGVDMPQLARRAARAAGLRDSPVEFNTALQGITEFDSLLARWTIRDAVASTRDLAIETPLLRIRGAGRVDFDQATIDASLRVGPRVSNTERSLALLSRIGVPLRVRGQLRSPLWSIEHPVAEASRNAP